MPSWANEENAQQVAWTLRRPGKLKHKPENPGRRGVRAT